MDIESLPEGSTDYLKEEEWKAYMESFIPFSIFMGVIFVVGTIGNTTVLTVYFIRYKSSTYRTCILTLAAMDLTSSTIGVMGYLAEERFGYTYTSTPPCVILATLHFFILSFSYVMLSFIAIERYRRSCKPFAHQITVKESKFICAVLAVACLLIASPSVWISGIITVQVEGANVTGHRCGTVDKSSKLTKGYYVICLLLLLVSLVVCGTMYTFVSRVLIQRRNEFQRHSPISAVVPSTAPETVEGETGVKYVVPTDHEETSSRVITEQFDSASNQIERSETSTDHHIKTVSTEDFTKIIFHKQNQNVKGIIVRKKKVSNEKKKKKSKKAPTAKDARRKMYNKSVRITMMFLVASVLSCLSAVPLLLVQVIEEISSSAAEALEQHYLWLGVILPRFQLINHICNPFVYGFMDSKFRTECKLFCERVIARVGKACRKEQF